FPRRRQPPHGGGQRVGRREEDRRAGRTDVHEGELLMKIAAAVLFACLAALPLAAQDSGKMEADAKRAFDAGRFQEAGEKYAKAAEAPDLTADRKSEL